MSHVLTPKTCFSQATPEAFGHALTALHPCEYTLSGALPFLIFFVQSKYKALNIGTRSEVVTSGRDNW